MTGVLDFPDATAWEAWLDAHQAERTEAWLRIAKKNSGLAAISITEALDVALCFGWIDGQRKSHDEAFFLQRYCRRRKNSSWSKVNVEKAEALIVAGRMRPAGFAEVAAAQADGRWELAYVSQANFTVPPDLAVALDGNPAAKAAFDALAKSQRYTRCLPLLKSRDPASRARQVDRLIASLAQPG